VKELGKQVRERTLAQIVLIGMVIQLMCIGFTFWSSYAGRVTLQTNMRNACTERNRVSPGKDVNCNKAFPKASLLP
jgi:hypothetical protein